MCGIYGIWNLDRQPLKLEHIERATNILRHRGPDDEGYLLVETGSGRRVVAGGAHTSRALQLPPIDAYSDQLFDLSFGFRRLAILDLSPSGHQPMSSAGGQFWIVFNGEIYNYVELRVELSNYGYTFQTGTDTEVILAAYQHWGAECLSHLNGMWAFAIWDHNEQSLFIARDRFGVKPLYYVHFDANFVFASEIKALVGKHGIGFEPNDQAIYQYLANGVLPSPQRGTTFFQHVQSLPPGHFMVVHRDKLSQYQYWRLPAVALDGRAERSASEAITGYRELFVDSVRLQLRADVPVGTCLSGGLDSSSIVGVVNRLMAQEGLTTEQIGQQQKTFSAVYEKPGRFNERAYIEKVVQATGAEKNFTFPTAERLQNDIEQLIWYQDEPFQSTSIFAQWCVMHAVRERGVTVLLDGQGADEALAGYRPFSEFLGSLIRRAQIRQALREARAIQARTGVSMVPLVARSALRQVPFGWLRKLRQRRARLRVDVSALNSELVAEWYEAGILDWMPSNTHDSLEGHLQHLVHESSLPHLLRYEDRNSMAFGVEARVPYLDHRLVEFAFSDASRWRIHQGWTKWVLRKAMEETIPEEIVWRRDKVGFETPEHDWMAHWLRSQPDFFDDALSRDYLDVGTVRHKLAAWAPGDGDARMVWRWINFEMWLRLWHRA